MLVIGTLILGVDRFPELGLRLIRSFHNQHGHTQADALRPSSPTSD